MLVVGSGQGFVHWVIGQHAGFGWIPDMRVPIIVILRVVNYPSVSHLRPGSRPATYLLDPATRFERR